MYKGVLFEFLKVKFLRGAFKQPLNFTYFETHEKRRANPVFPFPPFTVASLHLEHFYNEEPRSRFSRQVWDNHQQKINHMGKVGRA